MALYGKKAVIPVGYAPAAHPLGLGLGFQSAW